MVSFPSWFLFEKQSKEYRNSVLPKNIPTVSVEAASPLGWDRYSQAQVAMTTFGASGKGEDVMKHFGFTVENVVAVAKDLLNG